MMYIRTNKKSNNPTIYAIVVIIIVVIFFVIQFFIPHFFPSIVTTIARPFWRADFSLESGSLKSQSALMAENESLKRDIQTLNVEYSSLGMIQEQNDTLLGFLGRKSNDISTVHSTTSNSSTTASTSIQHSTNQPIHSLANRILAAVLVRPPLAKYDEIIIDVGLDHSIQTGSYVYASGNVLIGKVVDVLGQTSKVMLLSSPKETYPVLIGLQHIPATATGRGGGQYEAQVPHAITVNRGDLVSDSTISDGVFGTVVSVLNNPSDAFQTVLFAPPVNIFQLRWVLVDTSHHLVTATSSNIK